MGAELVEASPACRRMHNLRSPATYYVHTKKDSHTEIQHARQGGRGRSLCLPLAMLVAVASVPVPVSSAGDAATLRPAATRDQPDQRENVEKALLLAENDFVPESGEVAEVTQLGRLRLEQGHRVREGTLDPRRDDVPWLTLIVRAEDGSSPSVSTQLELITQRYRARTGRELPAEIRAVLARQLRTLLAHLAGATDLVDHGGQRRRVTLLLNLDDLLKPIPLATLDTPQGRLDLFAKGGAKKPDFGRPFQTINFTLAVAHIQPDEFRTIVQHEVENLAAGAYVDNATTRRAQWQIARAAQQAHTAPAPADDANDGITIADEGTWIGRRADHEAYHDEGQFHDVIRTLANELSAPRRSNDRFDLRSIVEAAGGNLTTSHGLLRIESDGVLVIIDDRFREIMPVAMSSPSMPGPNRKPNVRSVNCATGRPGRWSTGLSHATMCRRVGWAINSATT